MSHRHNIVFTRHPATCAARLSVLHFVAATGTDPLPSARATAASLLGVYSEDESAARAARCAPALQFPAALVEPVAGARQSRSASRRSRRRSPSAGEQARPPLRRGRRSDPAKGVRSLRTYLRSPLQGRPSFTRRSKKNA